MAIMMKHMAMISRLRRIEGGCVSLVDSWALVAEANSWIWG